VDHSGGRGTTIFGIIGTNEVSTLGSESHTRHCRELESPHVKETTLGNRKPDPNRWAMGGPKREERINAHKNTRGEERLDHQKGTYEETRQGIKEETLVWGEPAWEVLCKHVRVRSIGGNGEWFGGSCGKKSEKQTWSRWVSRKNRRPSSGKKPAMCGKGKAISHGGEGFETTRKGNRTTARRKGGLDDRL